MLTKIIKTAMLMLILMMLSSCINNSNDTVRSDATGTDVNNSNDTIESDTVNPDNMFGIDTVSHWRWGSYSNTGILSLNVNGNPLMFTSSLTGQSIILCDRPECIHENRNQI